MLTCFSLALGYQSGQRLSSLSESGAASARHRRDQGRLGLALFFEIASGPRAPELAGANDFAVVPESCCGRLDKKPGAKGSGNTVFDSPLPAPLRQK